jgi:hypothetical protein
VFSSVGDKSNADRWLQGRRNFDLWITYYGDQECGYTDSADYYNSRKGSKFQNLKFAYDTWPERFAPYEAVMVMDDDILISGGGISRLFELRREFDLWVLQPAFNPVGKISWPVTRVEWSCKLRFTNFVEMTCPLFRRDKLDAFMAVYDPVLSGFGMDWWFLEVLGRSLEGNVAVIDEIPCVNPHDRTKGRVREINKWQSQEAREAVWADVKRRHGIRRDEVVHCVYRRMLKPAPARWLSPILHVPVEMYVHARYLAWLAKRKLTRVQSENKGVFRD